MFHSNNSQTSLCESQKAFMQHWHSQKNSSNSRNLCNIPVHPIFQYTKGVYTNGVYITSFSNLGSNTGIGEMFTFARVG